jgi:two-component system, cell cycle sensor histidine kinase and response regulator CckA
MSTALRVLVVEDSEDDTRLLVRELSRGGYDVSFERVDTADAMLAAIENQHWDVVVCDYSLPHYSGAYALQLLRQRDTDTPFFYVSGTIGEEIAVAALKQGAQDYVMKGNLKRLLPAIQRELKEVTQRRERVQLERQLRLLERFDSIGRLAGGISHDFNNVLAAILGWAQIGEEEAPAGSRSAEYFRKIRTQGERASGLTGQLLAFARCKILQPEKIDLNHSISGMLALVQSGMGETIKFEQFLGKDLNVIRGDRSQVDQVIMNLCINAKDAMPSNGRLTVRTGNVEIDDEFCCHRSNARPGCYVVLEVSDNGIGMDPATLDRIFEPFFTTKKPGKGTGLGLATVYAIVKQHEGFIDVDSEPGVGTTFKVYFPATAGTPTEVNSQQPQTSLAGSEFVLVAEDHEGLRELIDKVLTSHGYRTILADNGESAVHLFQENCDKIQMIVLDVVMPLLSGPDAYDRMSAIKRGIPVIFTTGHTAEQASLNARLDAGAVCLQKPYALHKLIQTIRLTLDRERHWRPAAGLVTMGERLQVHSPKAS